MLHQSVSDIGFFGTIDLILERVIDQNVGADATESGVLQQNWIRRFSNPSLESRNRASNKWKGYVTAINADDGSVKWKYQSPTPMVAGITTTGGGLVLTADLNGDVLALNAADGQLVWKQNTGSAVGGGVITYLAGGKQYVAVAAGITSKSWQTKAGNAKVAVYALP